WLESRKGAPDLAVIGVDPHLAGLLRSSCPGIEIALPVTAARDAVLAAAERSLRAVVRDSVTAGSNFRERTDLLARSDDDLDADERDEISMWSAPAVVVRR